MMEVLSLPLRQNVFGQLYQENMENGKPYTITHFVAMRIPRRTIYRIIEVMERTWSTEGVAGSGPPASKLPQAARKRMAKAASNKVGITARNLQEVWCRLFICHQSTQEGGGEVLQRSERSEELSRACVSTKEVLPSNGQKSLQALVTN